MLNENFLKAIILLQIIFEDHNLYRIFGKENLSKRKYLLMNIREIWNRI